MRIVFQSVQFAIISKCQFKRSLGNVQTTAENFAKTFSIFIHCTVETLHAFSSKMSDVLGIWCVSTRNYPTNFVLIAMLGI